MRLLRNFDIQTKNSIISAILLLVVFILFVYVVLELQKTKVEENYASSAEFQLKAINNNIATLNQQKKEHIQKAMALTSYTFQENSLVKEINETITIDAKNEITRESFSIEVKVWMNEGVRLHTNTSAVDNLKLFTGAEIGIFQETKGGYVQISTTILNRRADKAIGVFFPNSHALSKIIDKGERYQGIITLDGVPHFAAARPYFISGNAQGFALAALPVFQLAEIKQIIHNFMITPGATLNLINKNDKLVFSTNELRTEFPVNPSKLGLNSFEMNTIRNQKGSFDKSNIFIIQIPSIEHYLALEIPLKVIYANLNNFRLLMFLATFLAIILLFLGINLANSAFIKDIKTLTKQLEDVALGKFVEISAKSSNKEVEKLNNYLGIINEGNKEKSEFINQLKSGNLLVDYKVLSKEDIIGNELLELKQELKKTNIAINTNKEQDEKLKWFNEGKSRISDILREHSSNIIGLGDELIKEIINFLKIPLGGIFIVNEGKDKKKYLDLLSAYAYDRKKFIEKRILIGDGLIGACAQEQYTMHIKGVPDDYIRIESGLGGKSPEYLLLSPIVADNRILGVVELASFHEFTLPEINYIESISEAIASTITITRLNTQTSIMLEESQEKIEYLEKEKNKLEQELLSLTNKFSKLIREYTDAEFQYKTQIVKKQMTIDNLNRRLENLELK